MVRIQLPKPPPKPPKMVVWECAYCGTEATPNVNCRNCGASKVSPRKEN